MRWITGCGFQGPNVVDRRRVCRELLGWPTMLLDRRLHDAVVTLLPAGIKCLPHSCGFAVVRRDEVGTPR